MKLIASGDHHWDIYTRLPECERIHQWILELVIRERPDAFISTGDIYDSASTPRLRMLVAEWLQSLAEVCPVLVVKGNHDQALDCHLMQRLTSRYPIYVEESASVRFIGGAAIAAVAWPERSSILNLARARGIDPDLLAQDALQHVFRGLGHQLSQHDGPRIVAGHFMVDGCVTSVGQPLIGQPMNVGLADLGLFEAQLVLMGHIHKPQDWLHGGAPMLYTGSPFRTSFGETEEKSVVMAEFEGARLLNWQRIPTPCSGMHLVSEVWSASDGCFGGDTEMWIDPAQVAGAEIRFRYDVLPDARDAARAGAQLWRDEWLAQGASHVKVEEMVVSTTVARAPEVAAALTLSDKLIALWKSRGSMPEPPRQERLIEMAHTLERESAAQS